MYIPEKFDPERRTVCVQGLGFVGSAMALAVASAKGEHGEPCYNVVGIDIPNEAGYRKAMSLNEGKFPFENNDAQLQEAMASCYENGNLWATTDSTYFKLANVVIVDINLDVSYREDGTPYLDLNPFKGAMCTLGENIGENTLVIVETTVPPGTCEKVVYPILQEKLEERGLDKKKIFVAHSYERVMPGENYFDSIVNFWRVFSGINDDSAKRCEEFLKSVISIDKFPLKRLEKTTATETAKVLENSYRATTIAFMEEWGRFAEAVGVDLFEIIDAIRMRPTHSNMRQPGFGVGGYCLTKDPYFAKLSASDLFGLEGHEFWFSTTAAKINKEMPLVTLNYVDKLLGGISGKKILVLGVSYRQDVGDTRYSPTEIFAKAAIAKNASLDYQDPLVSEWLEMGLNVKTEIPSFDQYDAIVFTVQHKQYMDIDFSGLELSRELLVFDANRVLCKKQIEDISKKGNLRFFSIGRGILL